MRSPASPPPPGLPIHSSGGIYVDRGASANVSDTQRSVFHYANLDVTWEHRTWGVSQIPTRHWTDQWGTRFVGPHGTLKVTLFGYEFTPADGGPREGFHHLSKTDDLENIDFTPWMHAFLAVSGTPAHALSPALLAAVPPPHSPPIAGIPCPSLSTSNGKSSPPRSIARRPPNATLVSTPRAVPTPACARASTPCCAPMRPPAVRGRFRGATGLREP